MSAIKTLFSSWGMVNTVPREEQAYPYIHRWRNKMETNLENSVIFDRGVVNPYGKYFSGTSYLNMLTLEGVITANVTFEPCCINNWHIHNADKGGGQILLITGGRGYYQEFGKDARELHAGDVVVIPAGVKHWHGAAKDSWFVHIAVEVPGENGSNEWLEPVDANEYAQLP